jgi:hypothetical protein
MSDIHAELDTLEKSLAGSATLDTGTLVSLPPVIKRVILYLLRSKNGMSGAAILEAEGSTKEDERLSSDDIQAILGTLEAAGCVKARKRRGTVLYHLVFD